jgi:hypothetical protein
LLKNKETQTWQEKFWNDKWTHMNEEIEHMKITSCTKTTELQNVGNFSANENASGKTKWK